MENVLRCGTFEENFCVMKNCHIICKSILNISYLAMVLVNKFILCYVPVVIALHSIGISY